MAADALEKLTGAAAPEKVAGGFRDAAGPVFHRLGYLLFTDAPSGRILKLQAGSVTTFRENSNGAAGLTFDHQGRLLACERGRLTRTEKNGSVTVLAEKAGGRKLVRPAAVVYAIDGSIYFTDPGAAVVCQITRKGDVRVAARDCKRPAGVALAPNQMKLYVGDSARRSIRVYDVAPDGALQAGAVFAEAAAVSLATDEQGRVWSADHNGVTVFDAAGRRLGAVSVPEPPGGISWGEGFRGLYIAARTSLYRIPAKVAGTRTF